MTVIRVARETGGLSISLEGPDGSPTTIVFEGAHPGPLAIAGPPGGSRDNTFARPRRSWLLGGLCFVLAIAFGIAVTGRHSAAGANAGTSLASASAGGSPGLIMPSPAANYPAQVPAPGQLPPAIASAFAQPPVVSAPPGETSASSGQGEGRVTAPPQNTGALFGLQP